MADRSNENIEDENALLPDEKPSMPDILPNFHQLDKGPVRVRQPDLLDGKRGILKAHRSLPGQRLQTNEIFKNARDSSFTHDESSRGLKRKVAFEDQYTSEKQPCNDPAQPMDIDRETNM